jgi:hypothetical protein
LEESARITEFLRLYPVDWINFDVFTYGVYRASQFKIQPAWFAQEPFREILGRAMPEDGAKIAPEESLKYMREVLARQFHRIFRPTSPFPKAATFADRGRSLFTA